VSERAVSRMRCIVRDNWIFVQALFSVKRGKAGAP
jgi:hypothetical protein